MESTRPLHARFDVLLVGYCCSRQGMTIAGGSMIASEVTALERIAREYREPDAGRLVDQKTLAWTADRLLPWISGPDVLELGFGDDQWTTKIIDEFGHSHVVDASASLLETAKDKYGSRITVYSSLFEE